MIQNLGSPLLLRPKAHLSAKGKNPVRVILSTWRVVGVSLGLLVLFGGSFASTLLLLSDKALQPDHGSLPLLQNLGLGSLTLGFSLALLTNFIPRIAPLTAPVYALTAGLFTSTLSLILEPRYPGIATQTAVLSLMIALVALILYALGWIKPTRRFVSVVLLSTTAISLLFLIGLLFSLFGWHLKVLSGEGLGGLMWYAFIATIASLNLLIDFERIDSLRKSPQPEYLPYHVGLGLLVSLAWLYLSVLRLQARSKG